MMSRFHEPVGPIPRCDCFCYNVDSAPGTVRNRRRHEDRRHSSRPLRPLVQRISPFGCSRIPWKVIRALFKHFSCTKQSHSTVYKTQFFKTDIITLFPEHLYCFAFHYDLVLIACISCIITGKISLRTINIFLSVFILHISFLLILLYTVIIVVPRN